jgi:hypothetical protein
MSETARLSCVSVQRAKGAVIQHPISTEVFIIFVSSEGGAVIQIPISTDKLD